MLTALTLTYTLRETQFDDDYSTGQAVSGTASYDPWPVAVPLVWSRGTAS